MDSIKITDAATVAQGEKAVAVFTLAALAAGLRFEMRCPGMRMSRHMTALAAAKARTGLRTNSRAKQLERVLLMLEQAKSEVLIVGDE